eukprot:TRINITY_DN4581_c0_g1_i2.p1 TRINITY_DN4581_c0_g1~~TRINITY_DN4581_c0_g1_i2.p1  ORF type:complete len:393 (-),score=79.73 TRINITY_DN4581_c0_g1_i2:807-1985(-)
MIEAVFFYNKEGDIILYREYCGVLKSDICIDFWKAWKELQRDGNKQPIVSTEKCNFAYVEEKDMILVSAASHECDPFVLVEYLLKLVQILGAYFAPLSEASIQESIGTVYQILEETVNCGIPNMTDLNPLVEMIPPPSLLRESLGQKLSMSQITDEIPAYTFSAIPWRNPEKRHLLHTLELTVQESIQGDWSSIEADTSISVLGKICCKSFLSGKPVVELVLSNIDCIQDYIFHPCVDLKLYQEKKVVSFIPPDGDFELMTYWVKGLSLQKILAIKFQASLESGKYRFNLTLQPSQESTRKNFSSMSVSILLPKNISSSNFMSGHGLISTNTEEQETKWSIGGFHAKRPLLLQGDLILNQKSGWKLSRLFLCVACFTFSQFLPFSSQILTFV